MLKSMLFITFAFTATAFGATPIAASDADVAKQFGLIGNWAINCAQPAGPYNPHQTFAVDGKGVVTLTMTDNIKGQDVLIALRGLKLVGDDRMSGAWLSGNGSVPVLVMLQKHGNMIHSWESMSSKGEKLISHGHFAGNRKPTPWATKYSAK
jgi:hypothetical protein